METRTLPFSLLSLAFLLVFGPAVVRGNAIASWWVETDELYAPQVFKYNETTGKIYSSLCNSVSEPVFAQNDSTALETTISPIANSSIASVGYLSGSSLETNIFYLASLNKSPAVATASYTCNASTGRWAPSGAGFNRYISNVTSCDATGATPAIDPSGGLSALYLGVAHGSRVFFKTAAFQTHYLQNLTSLSGDNCTGWSYAGIASNLTTGHEVSSAFLSTRPLVWTIAQTVFVNESSAVEDTLGEVEIATSMADGVEDLWSINRMPTQIIAELKENDTTAGILSNMSTTSDSAYRYVGTNSWDFTFSKFSGADARVGTITDSGGIPTVFYIGTDGVVRRYASDSQGHWHEDDSEDSSRWPTADAANADFGIAYDSDGNRIWLFYESGGGLGRAYQSGTSVWADYARLASYNSSSGNSSSSLGGNSTATAGNDMSAATKTGLGVGLGLGIPIVLGTVGLAFFLLRRRSRSSQNGHDSQQYQLNTTSASPVVSLNQNQGYWQNGMWVEKTTTAYYAGGPARGDEPLGELPVAPVYEMPADGEKQTLGAHEMPTDKHAQEMAVHKQDPFAEETPANK